MARSRERAREIQTGRLQHNLGRRGQRKGQTPVLPRPTRFDRFDPVRFPCRRRSHGRKPWGDCRFQNKTRKHSEGVWTTHFLRLWIA